MKRLFLAVAVLGLMACAKKEEAAPPAAQTPAAAPAPTTDTMKAMTDTAKKAETPAPTTKAPAKK